MGLISRGYGSSALVVLVGAYLQSVAPVVLVVLVVQVAVSRSGRSGCASSALVGA